ncbi:MAG TPA: glycosyltransferase N-terminal domain-containing protein [Bacteroidales bacterium]|jgi:3-deoxy-D-manno-octulosonic-acid transferase|nr:glycosyltransferase N-terminal domain-containing protein [Bacteroidales bacterium]HQH23757.1 glycosyltransferase N-terminal domain-containing protein [Bacteroidales bacterium]HQJ81582.1 glycosyltransferase N-terminal domain-containing protein [Bacteroidales bacterium]
MILLYRLGILFYSVTAMLISPFSSKAKLLVRGRRNSFRVIRDKRIQGDRYVWMHCASLGEFEQGRPVIEAIREKFPEFRILLTFFSPSGYEVRKNYPGADIVCYLPSDTGRNAAKLLDAVKPELVIFVKYEYWKYYLEAVAQRGIPLLLVSALFRREQIFFRWYGAFFRKILENFSHIFVQDEGSAEKLESLGVRNVTVSGDTRFDRVLEIAAAAKSISQIESFRGSEKLFLAGSSWKPDEEIIVRYINDNPGRMKWVFAPHETDRANIDRLVKLFRVKCVRFSEYGEGEKDARVMIIDNVGMLSSAYRYAYIAAVGGGFGRGIHNILEPATWGVPVLFGPNHEKFREALNLIYLGGAKSFSNYDEFRSVLEDLSENPAFYERSSLAASEYVRENAGATKKIMEWISSEVINSI